MSSKKKKERGQFRHTVQSKPVILREKCEDLVNSKISSRLSLKGQNMPDLHPPLDSKNLKWANPPSHPCQTKSEIG